MRSYIGNKGVNKKWVGEGDASSEYFHTVANGRRCHYTIRLLRDDNGIISGEGELQAHIYGFFWNLLGTSEQSMVALNPSVWDSSRKVSDEENLALLGPFSLRVVSNNLGTMRANTTPGPDGFPVTFYKALWEIVGPQFLSLVLDFTNGRIDVKQLNYRITTKGRGGGPHSTI